MKHRKKENNPRAAADKIAQYIHTASQKTAVMKFGGHSVSVKPFKLFAALAVILVIIGLISFILSFGTDIKSVDAEFQEARIKQKRQEKTWFCIITGAQKS